MTWLHPKGSVAGQSRLRSTTDVRAHVLQQLEIMSPGSGFVFQQVHNIMADVPPANVVAMFDAIAEFNAQGWHAGR